MRVIMFPAVGVKNENRYIDILVAALREKGVTVEGWTKHLSFQKGDIFHIHWPEIVAEIKTRKFNSLRGTWIAFQFFQTIRRIKKSGGRVVWTVHDLYPHNLELRKSAYLKHFMNRFTSEIDAAISLTTSGIDQIRQYFPSLDKLNIHVAHHPHYRQVLRNGSYNLTARADLGIGPEQRTFSFIGTLRPNKRPDLVADGFANLPADKYYLIMAGGAAPSTQDALTKKLSKQSNVKLDFRRISEEEIVRFYSVTDIFVFPGTDYLNSGTIYTALSLNVPVIAAWGPTNAELQQIVGAEWLNLYQGDFSAKTLEEGARTLIKRDDNTICDLSLFSPEQCAQEHIQAYERSLSDDLRRETGEAL